MMPKLPDTLLKWTQRVEMDVPVSRLRLAQECLDRIPVFGDPPVASAIGDTFVHGPLRLLDRIRMRTAGEDEVWVDPAPWPRQPGQHLLRVTEPGIIQY